MKEGAPTQGYGSDLGEIIVAARGHSRGPGWSTGDRLLGAIGLADEEQEGAR